MTVLLLAGKPSASSQLVVIAVVIAVVLVRVLARMRPQPVRLGRLGVSGAAICAALLLGFASTGGPLVSDPLTWVLLPLFLVAGAALGAGLVQTLSFWVPEDDTRVWMRGGVAFVLILVATILLRLAVDVIANPGRLGHPGPHPAGPPTALDVVSPDLLWFSLGLWGTRALLIYRRVRHQQLPASPTG